MGAGGAVAGIGVVMKVGADIMSAQSEEDQYRAVAASHEKNAEIREKNASQIIAQSTEDEIRSRIMTRRTYGDQEANYGASGVELSGSALDILAETKAMGEMDALAIRRKGRLDSRAQLDAAKQDRQKAYYARVAGSNANEVGRILLGAVPTAAAAYPTLASNVSGGGDS